MFLKTFAGALALSSLAACSVVGPNYSRPAVSMPSTYAFAHSSSLRQAAEEKWWLAFKDPALNELMSRGLSQNLSVKAAQARIEEAEALLRAAGPYSGLSGDARLTGRATAVEGGGSDTTVSGSFTPSFIVDLFGGRERASQRASANLMAAVFDKAAAQLAMQLAVVDAYVNLRYFEQALAIQQRSVANKSEVVENIRARIEAGDSTRVELRRAEAELDLERSSRPDFIAGQRVAVLSLATLLSEQGGTVRNIVSKSRGQPRPGSVRAGVPGDLLRNRPDVRAAESRLEAAFAEVGVFEADLYPSLRIDGTVTAASVSSISLIPALIIPVLDRPVRQARRDAAKARAELAEVEWRRTILDSVEEVQVALVRLEQAGDRATALRKAETTYRDARRLSQEAYELNSITVLDILETEDNLTDTQLQLAAAVRNQALQWAQLKVGIGQGWSAHTPLVVATKNEASDIRAEVAAASGIRPKAKPES